MKTPVSFRTDRCLLFRDNEPAKVIDLDKNQMIVSSAELTALIAVSKIPFTNSRRSADSLDRD